MCPTTDLNSHLNVTLEGRRHRLGEKSAETFDNCRDSGNLCSETVQDGMAGEDISSISAPLKTLRGHKLPGIAA